MVSNRFKLIIAVIVLATTLCGCGLGLDMESAKEVTYKELRYNTKYDNFYKYLINATTERNNMKLSVKDNKYNGKTWVDVWNNELFKELTKTDLENLILDYKLLANNYENQGISDEFTSDFYNYLSTNTSMKLNDIKGMTDDDKLAKRASELLLHSFTKQENNTFTAFMNYAKQGTFTFGNVEVSFSSIFYKGEGRGIKFDEALENPMLIRKLTTESLKDFLLDMTIISNTYENEDAIDIFLKKVKIILFTESDKKQSEVDNIECTDETVKDRIQAITGIDMTELEKAEDDYAKCRVKFREYFETGETPEYSFKNNDYAGYSYMDLYNNPTYLSKYGSDSLSLYFTDIKIMCKEACIEHPEHSEEIWRDFYTNLITQQYITVDVAEKTSAKMTAEKEEERREKARK